MFLARKVFNGSKLLVSAAAAIFFCLNANADIFGLQIPEAAWLHGSLPGVEEPTYISEQQQIECTQDILSELNRHFRTHFTEENVVPVKRDDWLSTQGGFVHGGGFNIRIVATLPVKKSKKIKVGRFSDLLTWFKLGAQSSLHLPGNIDGEKVFNKSVSEDGSEVNFDFIAHIDSAYAYLPAGAVIHFFRDVLGHKGRNPCPAGREVDEPKD
jgi:hypothetical protein